MPSFLSTYSSVGIPVVPRASQPPVPALSAPSLFDYSLVPSTSSPTLAPSVGKAFVVGPGYAPIPWKLVAKITSGAFNELADLLAENIRAQESEPHTYLDGKLLVAPAKKRVVEIFSHGFRPLPFTSGSSAVLTLLAGRRLPSISY